MWSALYGRHDPALAEAVAAGYPQAAEVMRVSGSRAIAVLPLSIGDRIIGVLGLSFMEERRFDRDERDFAAALAHQCTQALDRARLYDAEHAAHAEAESRRARTRLLYEVSRAFAEGGLDLPATIASVVRNTAMVIGDSAALFLLSGFTSPAADLPPAGAPPEGHPMECAAVYNLDEAQVALSRALFASHQVRAGEGVSGRAELAERRIAEQRATDALRARSEFLSIAAHELKTPVTSILAHAQLLQRGRARGQDPTPERLDTSLAAIEGQSHRLRALVEQLLDVGRLETGRFAVRTGPTDLAPLVRALVEAVRPSAERHQLRLTAPDSLMVTVDRLRIGQIVANLVDNAIKYSPDGGLVEVMLTVEGSPPPGATPDVPRADGWAVLSVRDHGIGVPPEHRDRIFDRFFQAENARYLSHGLGLGLYLARTLAGHRGGDLTAEFPEDGGTRMIVCLPLGDHTPSP
jgi:signal transduction histidine kinase